MVPTWATRPPGCSSSSRATSRRPRATNSSPPTGPTTASTAAARWRAAQQPLAVAEEPVAYQPARATVMDSDRAQPRVRCAAVLRPAEFSALAQRAQQPDAVADPGPRGPGLPRARPTVPAGTDIVAVVRLFQSQRTTSVLVSGLQGGLGIPTTLQRAVLDAHAGVHHRGRASPATLSSPCAPATSWATPWPRYGQRVHRAGGAGRGTARCRASWRGAWTCSSFLGHNHSHLDHRAD